MEKHDSQGQKTLGAAIDEIVATLESLDESSRKIAVKAACEKLGILLPESLAPGASPNLLQGQPPHDTAAVPKQTTVTPADIRTFARQKNPTTAIEKTVLVAYYLSELLPPEHRKADIDKNDLQHYFKQAGFPLPKRPEQALVNARHAGYLDPVGGGKYRLNPVGHNLIAHQLPRQGKGPKQQRMSTRGRARRKTRPS
ncbi:MAG TPA: hypothetical protein PLC08_00035 [Candidatus Bipolaricaulis sp.]|nr:hypothetical protein [Candidatus Bipolaricaulis sp.]HRS14576.1 hypothetical protein [Candidatus Bipolaricaulis sp.]HRU21658.1 hypothetical protein [Candidatus Bipolaricaulis sp.]